MREGFQVHGSAAPPETPGSLAAGDSGLAKALKAVTLPNYPSMTFGAAVEKYRYFTKREWKETRSSNGKIYVDFTGWLKNHEFDFSSAKNGISARAVGVKFLVNPDGRYGAVMASRVELKTDGNFYSYPMEDLQGILNKIYENKEIRF
jgi:hypothetical protein